MANRNGEGSATSQSKRPPLSQHGSDSQAAGEHGQQQLAYRSRSQKHHVGGGLGGRPHTRVPSSKLLHKHHAPVPPSKVSRRQASPSPERGVGSQIGSAHRRATSDVNLPRNTPASNLKKNSSHATLKPSRSKVDVGRKSKSSASLKRTLSNPAVHKLKSANVHFNLGDEDPDVDQEDEWVDSSRSASPLLSRRTSVAAGAPPPPPPQPQPEQSAAGSDYSRPQPSAAADRPSAAPESAARGGSDGLAHSPGRRIADHNQYITSRLLQRTPSHGAPPKMSTEIASVFPTPYPQKLSPASGAGQDVGSTPSDTPRPPSRMRPGSSGRDELTSRFVTNSSQGSGSAAASDSFPDKAARRGLSRVADATEPGEAAQARRLRSTGNLAQAQKEKQQDAMRAKARTEQQESTSEEGAAAQAHGLAAGARGRQYGGRAAPRGEMNRTQQKLDLQRASSNLETTHHHPGMGMGLVGVAAAAGPLAGGLGFESRDPRMGKVLERTGMEYLVVRRYQNPIVRSITRLSRLAGADKGRLIPRAGTPSVSSIKGHTRHSSEYSSIRQNAPQNPNDNDIRDPSVAGLISGQPHRRPGVPGRGRAVTGPNGIRGDAGPGETAGRQAGLAGLSGSSLADRGEDAQTIAILRNLWDKNMDLSASQD